MDLREIGERVKSLREAKKWSQKELARRAKCSQQHVSYVERAATNVTWSKLEAILAALDQRLWVHVQDTKVERVPIEVTRPTADAIDAFESLSAAERERAVRFARSLPCPPWFEGMLLKTLETLEVEANRRRTQEERRRAAKAPKPKRKRTRA